MNNNNAFGGIKFDSEDISYGQGQRGECISWSFIPRVYQAVLSINGGTILCSLSYFSLRYELYYLHIMCHFFYFHNLQKHP